ncbi:MAG TPA: SRPBCC domain-containing protein [Bryobacteraceae bacterium]|nr:SRPBCC domain-containing protein [Bryobacteraceae bacterium]
MPELPYALERSIVIQAGPETVFRFFTDSARWAAWWGAGSTIDARPGGKMYIRHPNGVETVGEVLEVRPPEWIAFTYGYARGQPIAPGGSRVTIRLEPDEAGTRLQLRHEFAEEGARDQHVQGWRFQLSLFANAVANEAYADAAGAVDAWFGAWTMADERARQETLARIAVPEIRFRDRFSALDGAAEVMAHIGAALRFMPGISLRRKGNVRHCQGEVLADWTAEGADGKERMSGTSLFVFRPDGRIGSVTGFTNPPASLE